MHVVSVTANPVACDYECFSCIEQNGIDRRERVRLMRVVLFGARVQLFFLLRWYGRA